MSDFDKIDNLIQTRNKQNVLLAVALLRGKGWSEYDIFLKLLEVQLVVTVEESTIAKRGFKSIDVLPKQNFLDTKCNLYLCRGGFYGGIESVINLRYNAGFKPLYDFAMANAALLRSDKVGFSYWELRLHVGNNPFFNKYYLEECPSEEIFRDIRKSFFEIYKNYVAHA